MPPSTASSAYAVTCASPASAPCPCCPKFVLPYLRSSILFIALFLLARLLHTETLTAAAAKASMPYQRGQFWIRRFRRQAEARVVPATTGSAQAPRPAARHSWRTHVADHGRRCQRPRLFPRAASASARRPLWLNRSPTNPVASVHEPEKNTQPGSSPGRTSTSQPPPYPGRHG